MACLNMQALAQFNFLIAHAIGNDETTHEKKNEVFEGTL